jgi:hypothetical protein
MCSLEVLGSSFATFIINRFNAAKKRRRPLNEGLTEEQNSGPPVKKTKFLVRKRRKKTKSDKVIF